MGCRASSLAAVGAGGGVKGKELSDYLTAQEKEIVRRNWAALQQDRISAGVYLFVRMFAQQDGFKGIFKELMTVTDSGGYQVDWNKVRFHATKVMDTLDKVVNHLQDSSRLTPELMELGKKHMQFYDKPDLPTLMWPALRDMLNYSLANDFSVDAELAWIHVFNYVTDKMGQGCVTARDGTPPPRPH